jgi:hypothetical protein
VSSITRYMILLFGVLVSGCAFNLADVDYSPARLQALNQQERTFTLAEDVRISNAPCGYSRALRKNTRWELIGAIAEGEVFRSRDQSLTVECSNVFEAYLVVSGERLVGLYLPVEKGFVALSNPPQLPITH